MNFTAFPSARIIRSEWLSVAGRRLDCNPYMSGAIEARALLKQSPLQKELLSDLTAGHVGGIYNGPMFKRNYVTSRKYGVPFISSGSMLLADLSRLPLLRKRDAESSRLSYLRLSTGTTLISCSGSIGRMSFVRPGMKDMWSSQDVLKVVPDEGKILPGYLYAFLSGKYGVPLVVAGTYGAIIQHIEPEHISGIEIPRVAQQREAEVDHKIRRAAELRDFAEATLRGVSEEFDALFPSLRSRETREATTSMILASESQARMDAEYHNPLAVDIRRTLADAPSISISDWCDRIFLPGIFKRIHVPGPESAALYFTGYSLYWNEPEPKGYLSKITKLFKEVQLEPGMILVQAFGQEGGLTGRPVWVGKNLAGATTTHMLVRLIVEDTARAAFLFGFLNSQLAYNQISCLTYGGSIPHFDEAGIRKVLVPRLGVAREKSIAQRVLEAVGARDEALDLELAARRDVEMMIAGGT